jgi:uncharacterized protein YndB with AHSA1/START domain
MNKQQEYLSSSSIEIDLAPEKVWSGLTEPDLVRQYFFGTELASDWKVGGPITFSGAWEGKPYQDKGIVLAYDPPRFLSYSYLSSWTDLPDLPENYLTISYHLEDLGGRTKLSISQENYDQEKAEHSRENWNHLLSALRDLLMTGSSDSAQ